MYCCQFFEIVKQTHLIEKHNFPLKKIISRKMHPIKKEIQTPPNDEIPINKRNETKQYEQCLNHLQTSPRVLKNSKQVIIEVTHKLL